ncbi:MAG: hypothetical protein GY803_04890 [Chloroflexi bacterium]|nr:hypothetical protein [Chloroflexota bacterium]
MTQYVNVPLPKKMYRRMKRWAETRQQDVGEAIADYLTDALPSEGAATVPPAETDPQVEREKIAYLKLHPILKKKYAGQYVAIYGGQLVDHDKDYGALFERIDDRYPDSFVWLTRVEDKPIGALVFRSPRLSEDT